MLTGQHIHQAYAAVFPANAFAWDDISETARATYGAVAEELNKMLAEDTVEITGIRCPQCKEMLEVSHAEGHACWVS